MKRSLMSVLLVLSLLAGAVFAQEAYKLPPKNVLDILDAPPTPRVSLNRDRDMMLLTDSESMPSIAYLSMPILRLAGLRITPGNNSRQVLSFSTGLSLKSLKDGQVRKIELPAGIKFTGGSWSDDGKFITFARTLDAGVELWIVDVATAKARALTGPVLNMVLGGASWMPDNRHILVDLVPEGRGPAPQAPRVPIGPEVYVSTGKATQVATYQDLLKTAFDEKLFEYYAAAQPAEVDVAAGTIRKIGEPGIFNLSPSPDGKYFLVNRTKRPFSYSVPFSDFAHTYELWDANGKMVKLIADVPVGEGIPMNGVETGPRSPNWQALKPATVYWVEALDNGDPEKDVPFRDKVMVLSAPFNGETKEVFKTQHRFAGFTWFATPGTVFASESNWKKRWRTTWLADIDKPGTEPKKIFDLNTQDAYNNPGSPIMTTTPAGDRVILQDKNLIYLQGAGASPKGDYPFIDTMDLKTGLKKRIWQCPDGKYESFVGFYGEDKTKLILSHESKTEVPNYILYDLKAKKATKLTDFADPAPQLTAVKKELIKYKRDDGIELSGTLYLPADYKPGTRLPAVVWAYPMEYGDASTAGQVRGSVNRFTFYRGTSQLFFVTLGYAVLDNATMPVVGDVKTVNDTFVKQIVANAKAAIDKLDQLGVADPKRVGVGGHSYGAFMTANLLARCDLFAAGIARSGAYNRTLTPFGFQSEKRTLWEARDTYINMSPFMFANQIKTPILMIHGMADNNSGTFPIQSERLFAALKGFGATARFVYLPFESHGYSGRESVLTVLAEMIEWFDTYVKNRK
jgi:dipeptidyl aminopeptidase/acylaminoacyl peptidase